MKKKATYGNNRRLYGAQAKQGRLPLRRNIFQRPTLACNRFSTQLLYALDGSELHVYSQNGEDGVLRAIFWALGEGTRYYVEIGAGTGEENNTRLLKHQGRQGLWLDAGVPSDHPTVRSERVNAENVVSLLARYEVPRAFDCLSIDTDLNDAYVLTEILHAEFRPRVMVVEYNAACGPEASLAVRYDAGGTWRGTNYFGASLAAYVLIGKKFGYSLIYCEASGNNAFFVADELIDRQRLRTPAELWRPPGYGGHPQDPEFQMQPFAIE